MPKHVRPVLCGVVVITVLCALSLLVMRGFTVAAARPEAPMVGAVVDRTVAVRPLPLPVLLAAPAVLEGPSPEPPAPAVDVPTALLIDETPEIRLQRAILYRLAGEIAVRRADQQVEKLVQQAPQTLTAPVTAE